MVCGVAVRSGTNVARTVWQPNNETLKPYVTTCLALCMDVLQTDNEENALVALRIIFDLHKNFRPGLEREVQPFLDFVRSIYKSLPGTVEEILNKPAAAASSQAAAGPRTGLSLSTAGAAGAAAAAGAVVPKTPAALAGVGSSTPAVPASNKGGSSESSGGKGAGVDSGTPEGVGIAPKKAKASSLIRSSGSFKVLTECPLITMLLFQLYPRYFNPNMVTLVPLMMQALQLEAHAAAVSTVRARFSEFLACQVKTLSFLTYLLRGSFESMKSYEATIAQCVIRLLKICPDEAVSTRKEILVATRHILATDFRKAFFPHVDVFLDEKILIGRGRQAHEVRLPVLQWAVCCCVVPLTPAGCRQTLRPLAYSTLADLVHHVRATLTLTQLSSVIHAFSRNIHDPSLPITIQTTSVRLLLNLVDSTFHNDNKDPAPGRNLLARILATLVNKFGTLQKHIPKVLLAEAEAAALARAKAVREHAFCNQMRKIATAHPDNSVKVSTPTPKAKPSAAGSTSEDVPMDGSAAVATPAPAPTTAGAGNGSGNGSAKKTPDSTSSDLRTTPPATAPPMVVPTSLFLQRARKRSSRSGSYSSFYPRNSLSVSQDIGEPDKVTDSTQDVKALVRTMILGLRTVVWCVSNYRRTANTPRTTSSLTEEELRLLSRFVKWGLRCIVVFSDNIDPSVPEEKEVLEHFAGVFTVIESHHFRDVFVRQLPTLVGLMLDDPAKITVVQHLLANSHAAHPMAELLFTFLVDHLHLLRPRVTGQHSDFRRAVLTQRSISAAVTHSREQKKRRAAAAIARGNVSSLAAVYNGTDPKEEPDYDLRASITLRLFKIVLGSVTHLFVENEPVLRPHLQKVVRHVVSCV